jgi:uncharacterized DUF497 family protein
LATYIRGGRILGDVVHERSGIRFVWDCGKADSNLRKHGVSFEAACEIFFDPFIQLLHSQAIGGEERESAIGMTTDWTLLVVVYTFREDSIRVISARPATSQERTNHEDSTAT